VSVTPPHAAPEDKPPPTDDTGPATGLRCSSRGGRGAKKEAADCETGARKRKRPTAKPIEEDILIGRNVFVNTGTDLMMPMVRVIKTAGNDSYQVFLEGQEGQEKIVKSINMVMCVSELEKDHWPTLLRGRVSVTVQRRDPDVVGPATFNGRIIALAESQFTVQTENRAEYENKSDEMLIAADIVLKVLRPRRPHTKKNPSCMPPPKPDKSAPKPDPSLQGAHGPPPSREDKKILDMVASFEARERESERKKERANERERAKERAVRQRTEKH